MHTSTDPGAMLTGDKKRVAIVGGGISGLAAAHLLEGKAHVTVFEAEPRLGGHARTVVAGKRGDQPVDTGFIVFNRQNYPLLTRLFEMLDVDVVESNMSFGASIDGGRLEYALRDLGAVFAQPRNAFNPRFLRMLRDILRFNSRALALANDPQLLIADEPTTALDVSVQAQIIALLKRLCRERGVAVMLVTHDMGVIAEAADRVAVMYAGRLAELGPVRDVILDADHPYTAGLMASTPLASQGQKRLRQIPGSMPRLGQLPPGCAFSPRCEFAQDKCKQDPGPTRETCNGRAACWFPLSSNAKQEATQ